MSDTTPHDPDRTLDPLATIAPPGESAIALVSRVGRYEVREVLGEGSFGLVYRAYDPQLDREAAVKVAKQPELAGRLDRFRREARAAAGLRHPNIVPLYEAGEEGGHVYLASAFVAGRTLAAALDERDGAGRPFEPRAAADIVRKLADALAYAHGQKVIHRDVKPANVMLAGDGEPHLLDFGLALRDDGSAVRTHDGTVLGTPAYLAPEVCKGERDRWSAAADQYALGVVLYELLTGHPPFEGPTQIVLGLHLTQEPEPPARRISNVPRDLEAICLKCLAKEPAHRYVDCAALADDLRRWLSGETTVARPMTPLEHVVRWSRRHRAVAAVSAGLIASVLGGLGVSWYLVAELRREADERRATVRRVIRFFRENPEAVTETDNDKLVAAFLSANPDISLQKLKAAIPVRDQFSQYPLAGTGGSSNNPNMIGD